MSFKDNDFITLEGDSQPGSFNGDKDFIQLEESTSSLGFLQDYSTIRKINQDSQDSPPPPPNSDPAGQGNNPLGDTPPPPPPPPSDTSDEPDDAPDTTNWVERSSKEIQKDLDFLGYTPQDIPDRDSYIFVKDQMFYIHRAFEASPDIKNLQSDLNTPALNLIEKEIRGALGKFATEKDVATKLSEYINEDKSINDEGNRIYGLIKQEKAGKLDELVEAIKADSKVYASGQLEFYGNLEKKVSGFQFPGVNIQHNNTDLEVFSSTNLSKAEVRQLRNFMETEYLDVADGKKVPEGYTKEQVFAENAFFLNRTLREAYIRKVASAAYQKGVSDQLSKLK